jgi:hypothetical protein
MREAIMSSHHHGTLYRDWQRMDRADAALQADLAHGQVLHPLSEYAEGSPHWGALWKAIELAHRFTSPPTFTINL